MNLKELTKERLKELLLAEEKLQCLEEAGVYDWYGYDDALKEFRKKIEIVEEICRAKEIFMDGLFEALIFGIEEPAGQGCGFGLSNPCRLKIDELFSEFVEKILKIKNERTELMK